MCTDKANIHEFGSEFYCRHQTVFISFNIKDIPLIIYVIYVNEFQPALMVLIYHSFRACSLSGCLVQNFFKVDIAITLMVQM